MYMLTYNMSTTFQKSILLKNIANKGDGLTSTSIHLEKALGIKLFRVIPLLWKSLINSWTYADLQIKIKFETDKEKDTFHIQIAM